ncbi:MAG: hypothetical protein PWQ11_573, partial [Candidatus Diapherotrites archaeon]|nr:hypothetical protein [Candidatus Diapherotrites archaeon]
DIEGNEGTVEVSTDKGDEYFTDAKYELTMTQKAWAETNDYSCHFDVYPQITVEETSEKIACKDVTCETILNNTSILKENGKSSEKGYEIAMIISNNSEEVVNCLKDKVEGGKESYPTATLKIKQGNSESTESIPIPLYSKGDRVYYLDGTQIVEQSSGGIWNGSDGVTITFEPEKSGSKLAEHVYIPYCGKVTYTLEITCENKVKRASNTLTIPCKSYKYYDVSGFFKIAGASMDTEAKQNNCGDCTTVYEVNEQDISINFDSAATIGENKNDLSSWYGPYVLAAVLAARLSNDDLPETTFRAIFGSVDSYKPKNLLGIKVTAYSCTKGTDTSYSCRIQNTDTCVQSSNDQGLIIYEVNVDVQNNNGGTTTYRFCTTDANLAWLYMEQESKAESETPWIIPAEVKVTKNKITFTTGDPLENCPVYDAEVNIPAVWIDPENNVSVFGKSLSDYYRIVAASVGANGKDTTGVKTFLGTDELNTVPPFNIGLKTGSEAISTEPSIVTNSGTGTVNITYQKPNTPEDEVKYLVHKNGTILYVYPEFAGYTENPLTNGLPFETVKDELKENQNIKPECQPVLIEGELSVDITLELDLKETTATCSAQNCTENGCTLTCGEVTILQCTDPAANKTTVEAKATVSVTTKTDDSQISWYKVKVTYGSLTKEGSIGETINLGQKSYSCPSDGLWNEVQEKVSVDLYGTRNDTSITVPASGTVTVRIGNAQ